HIDAVGGVDMPFAVGQGTGHFTAPVPGGQRIGVLKTIFHDTSPSDLVPADLVGFQVQRETGPVAAVYGGILRLVGVVDHTVLAVLYIGVYFHVAVVAEPGVQFALGMGG